MREKVKVVVTRLLPSSFLTPRFTWTESACRLMATL